MGYSSILWNIIALIINPTSPSHPATMSTPKKHRLGNIHYSGGWVVLSKIGSLPVGPKPAGACLETVAATRLRVWSVPSNSGPGNCMAESIVDMALDGGIVVLLP